MFISQNSKTSKSYGHLLAVIFSIGIALGSGFGYGFNQAISNIKQQELTNKNEFYHFSRAEYERLKITMSLSEVEAILGRGTEVSRSTTMATFIWHNFDGSKITGTFENGKLKSKEQSGLK